MITALLTVSACTNDSTGEGERQQQPPWLDLLENMADSVLIPAYEAASESSALLASSEMGVASYCTAIGAANEIEVLATVQDQWRTAMDAWQQVEVMQVGPLLENGQALRNRVYSFASSAPLSTCAVDQSVVLAQSVGFDLSTRANNSKGLDALEYLLFETTLDHTCPIQITETVDWNTLTNLERKQQRCHYAMKIAEDVAQATAQLVNRWLPTEEDYRYRFLNPTSASVEQQLTALSDGLFYVEKESKDLKLGVPTGLHTGCAAIACPDTLESAYAAHSIPNIVNNLVAFQRVFNGADGLGFDDIIRQAGFVDVANHLNGLIEDAITYGQTFNGDERVQLEAMVLANESSECANSAANPDTVRTVPVCSLHGYLKRITDVLRSDFVTIVNVDLPDRSQSDND